MKLKLLYVLRHGQTEWNAQRRMQGRLNSPLTEQGKVQADAHGAVLKRLGVLIIYGYQQQVGRNRQRRWLTHTCKRP